MRKKISFASAKYRASRLYKNEALKHSRFSKANIAIFGIIFAAIGGFFIYNSFAATTGVTVSGAQSLKDGQPFVMRGVNRSGSEYMCRTSATFFDGPNGTDDSAQTAAMKTWGINTVNIPFNESCWLGINGAAYGGTNYQNTMKQYVASLEANGITPVLALFWTAPGTQLAGGHGNMPDADHTPAMWQSIANTFKNDPYVVFRLDEEPHPGGGDTSLSAWDCWKNGDVQFSANGTLTPTSSVKHCNEGFNTVGMQSMINIIRGTGSTNVIQVPGIAWSGIFTHFMDSAYRVSDTLSPAQLMAAGDMYPIGNSCDTGCNVTTYNTIYAPIAAAMPYVAGELGPDINMASTNMGPVDTLLTWLDQHNAGYMAWVWDNWGETDDLISAYPGTVKSPWGTDFKNHLASLGANPTPLVTLTANPTSVTSGGSSTLTWSSTNATSCTATSPSGWTSSSATSGSQAVNNITAPTTYTISCTGSGGSAQASASVTVADPTPPTVSITTPASGATLSNSVTYSANASDNVGVAGVRFRVDGNNIGSEDTSSPYSISWDTTGVSNGTHSLTAVARDAAGNSTTSAAVSVTVSNTTITINDNTTGTGANQFNFGAGWSYDNTDASKYQSDDHYSSTAGSTATVSFSGTQIKAYVTTDSHHGLIAFSVDGGTETTFSEYSATRGYQVLAFTSPTLANSVHTLNIRVTGTNGTGGGNTVTIDKVVISSTPTGPKTGDLNGDNTVNITDLSLMLSSYGQSTTQCVTNSAYKCDLSSPADGVVNIFDLSILLSNYGS
jgi:endoglucanase